MGYGKKPHKFSRPTFPELYTNAKLLINRLGELKVAIDLQGDLYCEQAIRVAVLWKNLMNVNNRSIDGVVKKFSQYSRQELETFSRKVHLKYLLGILNSSYGSQLLTNIRGGDYHIVPEHIRNIPISLVDEAKQLEIANLVDRIIESSDNKCEKNQSWGVLNNLVYRIYDLSEEKIAVVEASIK